MVGSCKKMRAYCDYSVFCQIMYINESNIITTPKNNVVLEQHCSYTYQSSLSSIYIDL